MRNRRKMLAAGVALALCAGPALADDIEGRIDALDAGAQTLTVQGIRFQVTDATDFDSGLRGFDDLRTGQTVEVDFEFKDGKHYATEIELEK